MASKNKDLRFSVDSQLLGEIGEKLVTNNYIALAELVKNAYDADSPNLHLELAGAKKGSGDIDSSEIIISDEGHGMTFAQVSEHWMRIATANKRTNPTSERYGRPKTGNKGIGRFACQRLARYLELETTAKVGKEFEITSVFFDWEKFEPGINLEDVKCEFKTRRSNKGQTGLKLTLRSLREFWTQRDFTMLQRNLSLLSVVTPQKRAGFAEDPGFDVSITASEFSSEHVSLGEEYLEAGWATLTGRTLKDGTTKITLNAKSVTNQEYVLPDKFKLLYGLSFKIHWLPGKKEFDSSRNPTLLTAGVRRDLLEAASGIRVYLDGFRVYPYGEKGDDWLRIDQDVSRRRGGVGHDALVKIAEKLSLDPGRSMLAHPRNSSLIGSIFLSSEDSPFVIKMDREGLVENDALTQLRTAVRYSLDWLTLQYESQKMKAIAKKREAEESIFIDAIGERELHESERLDRALQYLEESSADLVKITAESAAGSSTKEGKASNTAKEQAKNDLSIVKKASSFVREKVVQQSAELDLLRTIASTGPLLFVFAHEVKGITGSLQTHAAYLEHVASKIGDQDIAEQLLEMASGFRDTKQRFNQLDALFDIFSSSQKLTPKRNPVRKTVEQIFDGFGFVFSQFSIEAECSDISPILKTPLMNEAEFYSVMVNLISNSLKASIVNGGKAIKVSADNTDNRILTINVMDKGVGLSKKHWESVFEPLTSDPENKIYGQLSAKFKTDELSTLGRGSGLGLSIVNSIVSKKRGQVAFVNPPRGWNTCVEIALPK